MNSLNGVRKRRLTAKETSVANCEVLDEKHRIAVQGISVGIIIKTSGASLKVLNRFVVCLRFFFTNKPGKLVSSLVGCLLFINFDT